MFLLQPSDFTGLYRIDLNPGLANDVANAVRQIELRVLRFLLGDYAGYIVNLPTPNLLGQAIINNGVGSIRFVSYGYRDYVLDYVISRLYSVVGYRGQVNEKNVYTISQNVPSALVKVHKDFCNMFIFMRNRDYQTDAFSNINVDISLTDYQWTEGKAILPLAVGMVLSDGTTTYTISTGALVGTVYTYTTTPAAPANARLTLLRPRLKICSVTETAF